MVPFRKLPVISLHLRLGLALSQTANAFVRLPSGISLREATVGHFEIGPLHNNLEKKSE